MTYKHSVIIDDISDVMIHPRPLFDRLKVLWKKQLSDAAANALGTPLNGCVACGEKGIYKYFSIWGYAYSRCPKCASVFLNPRPRRSFYEKAFFHSPISEFVTSAEYQDQHGQRFRRVIEPLLSEMIQESRSETMTVLEVFGRNQHVLNYLNKQEKIRKLFRFEAAVEDRSGRSVSVENLERLEDDSCDIILLLMAVEQMLAPEKIFPLLAKKMRRGGSMLVLARLGSGIDVQILRGKNPTVFPMEHMQLFSVEGYEHLCEESGMTVLELSTPGLLDVAYLRQHFSRHPKDDNVFQYFFQHRSAIDVERLQQFIQEVRLSSALKLICTKK